MLVMAITIMEHHITFAFLFQAQGVLYAIFFVASGLSFATALELLIRSASTMCYDQEE